MSYKRIISEIEEEYKVKRRRAEFRAEENYNQLLKSNAQVDEADTKLRVAMRKYGFSQVDKATVEEARKNLADLIESLGLERENYEPQYECTICHDTGKVGKGRCNCFMQKVYAKLYTEANLDSTVEENFDTFDLSVFPTDIPKGYKSSQRDIMQRVLTQAKEYVEQFPKNSAENILLLGPAGVGKTFLANCIARGILENGHTVLATNAFGLFDMLTKKLNGEDVDITHIKDAELLFIDDLGMEPILNNFTIEYLFEILNDRLKRRKHTIITSNLSPEEIRDRYTERIASRLFDKSHSLAIYLPGKDIRLIKR
jgi:DNA replication protein DnaC